MTQKKGTHKAKFISKFEKEGSFVNQSFRLHSFQIPSDVLSYDGPSESPTSDKVAVVKGYVRSVLNVIDSNKKKQLEEELKS